MGSTIGRCDIVTVTGLAAAAQCPPLIVVLMATMTGVFGGVLRDIITAQIPLILRREIGGNRGHHPLPGVAGVSACHRQWRFGVGMSLVVALRLLAIRWGLNLPVFGKS